jgi:hypothetical protein
MPPQTRRTPSELLKHELLTRGGGSAGALALALATLDLAEALEWLRTVPDQDPSDRL